MSSKSVPIVERLNRIIDEYVGSQPDKEEAMKAAALLERAGKVLKEVQWDPCCIQCPICRGRDSAGHAPTCELAAILKELE